MIGRALDKKVPTRPSFTSLKYFLNWFLRSWPTTTTTITTLRMCSLWSITFSHFFGFPNCSFSGSLENPVLIQCPAMPFQIDVLLSIARDRIELQIKTSISRNGWNLHKVWCWCWKSHKSWRQSYKRNYVLKKSKLILNSLTISYFNLDHNTMHYFNLNRGITPDIKDFNTNLYFLRLKLFYRIAFLINF